MAVVQVPPAVGTSGQFIDAVIITSSTLRQIIVVGDPATSGAFAPVTSSFGLLSNISSGSYLVRGLSSGTVTLSSNPTVISASSGLVQISGTVTILSASSGFVQALIPINSSAGFGPVTSSAGVLVSISSGTITLSSNPTVVLSSPTSLSSGTVILSSNPTIISASSGFVQIYLTVNSSAGFGPVTSSAGVLASLSSGTVTLSSNPTVVLSSPTSLSSGTVIMSSVQSVTATAATNPWSSAPGFNVPVINASSGRIQTMVSTGQTWTVFSFSASSSNSITNVTTSPSVLYGWNVGNQSTGIARAIKVYASTAPTVGSTTNLILIIPIPGSTAGAGNNMMLGPQGVAITTGLSFTVTANFAATDTGLAGAAGDVVGQLYFI